MGKARPFSTFSTFSNWEWTARVPRWSIATNNRNSYASEDDGLSRAATANTTTPAIGRPLSTAPAVEYKVYKRRWFGLALLVLLNVVVSWNWTTFAPISNTAATYFNTSETNINWLSTAYFFAFVFATPFTFYVLNKRGPRTSILISAGLLLAGNWIKYGGAAANVYGVVMFGQILIGMSQPFVLAAPSTFSNLWFTSAGRTSATAIASLANPFGAALGQLISPFWASTPSQIPNVVLYTAIIASAACVPSFFIPSRPPTPPSASVAFDTTTEPLALRKEVRGLFGSYEFWLIFIPFSFYVGFFNAFSSLINQILEPYGFTEDQAGIAGAVLILVGLVAAAISSPLIDRYKVYLLFIKCCVPVIAIMYLVMIWAPPTSSIPFVYVVCAVLGAASFSLVPIALEFMVEIHYPLGPETGSSICWAGGQLLGGIFVIIMDALRTNSGGPPGNMHLALIFQAVLAMVVMPLPLMLGLFGRHGNVKRKRWEAEQAQANAEVYSATESEQSGSSEGRENEAEADGQLRI